VLQLMCSKPARTKRAS